MRRNATRLVTVFVLTLLLAAAMSRGASVTGESAAGLPGRPPLSGLPLGWSPLTGLRLHSYESTVLGQGQARPEVARIGAPAGAIYLPYLSRNALGPPPTAISKDDALDIVIREILAPASSGDPRSAFMPSQPLRYGDVVASEDGGQRFIERPTWFVFVDDDPHALFAHPTRYVFIDAEDGSYQIVDEEWPPLVNDQPMFDPPAVNRGDLVEIYPPVSNRSSEAAHDNDGTAPLGDYGDAPDGEQAYDDLAVLGRFPTLYSTTNSVLGRPGAHALNTGEETLGRCVTAEAGANTVDGDPCDDGLYAVREGPTIGLKTLITVHEGAPDAARYLNILFDGNRNGEWGEESEWAGPNAHYDHWISPPYPWLSHWTPLPQYPTGYDDPRATWWARVALTREPIDEALFGTDGWDGSGQFQHGEVEDVEIRFSDGPPMDGGPPGNAQRPGPLTGPCGYPIKYHAIVFNCGDNKKHLSTGYRLTKTAADNMADLFEDQGYDSVTHLGPGKSGDNSNTLQNMEKAFDNLAQQVKCGDHVTVYLVGHGGKGKVGGQPDKPYIRLYDGAGKERGKLTPEALAGLLAKLAKCPGDRCDKLQSSCHVTVIIESCYSENFNVDGVTDVGRNVFGSAGKDEVADGRLGGVFSYGYRRASTNAASDTNGDGVVDPLEAFEGGKDAVAARRGTEQTPWKSAQTCDCTCPCTPTPTATPRPGGIEGQVYCGGTPLSGVQVIVRDAAGAVVYSTTTGSYGHYSTGLTLTPGTYTVTASKEGYTFTPSVATVTVQWGEMSIQDLHCVATPTPTRTQTPTRTPTRTPTPVEHYDGFDEPSSGWPDSDKDAYKVDYYDSTLRMRIWWPEYDLVVWNRGWMVDYPIPDNFIMEAQGFRCTGETSRKGLAFAIDKTVPRFLSFELLPTRQFRVRRYEAGEWDTIRSARYSEHIRPDPYSDNTLRVEGHGGGYLHLFINDHQVDTLYIRDLPPGHVGLYAGTGPEGSVVVRYLWARLVVPYSAAAGPTITDHSSRSTWEVMVVPDG